MLLSWSGGKDAAWALHVLRSRGEFEVVALLTTITTEYDRIAMQGIRVEVLHAQARAAGLPVLESRIPRRVDNAGYESAFGEALGRAQARWPGLREIAFGDLLLEDVKAYRESLCARLGWTPRFPLFGVDTTALARGMIEGGLRAHLCCVDTTQLDAGFAGRAFDERLLAELPAGVDRCGENGEFHTCVHAGPMFAHAIDIARGATLLRDERFAYTDFTLA